MRFHRKPLAGALTGIIALSATGVMAQGALEEVIVTAQKREAGVSDLGLSVTAFTGDSMRALGMGQPKDLAAQTPGLIINNTMGDAQPAVMIRGVGINDFNSNSNPGVAVYVDEVYKPLPAMLGFALFDMERVEVLKGPQGTLYGQNTTGGAVSFFSNKPGDELEGYVSADIGNYESSVIEGAVGGAFSDNVRGRISGIKTRQREGYQDNLLNGDDHGEVDRYAVRAQLAVDFGDSVEAILRYNYGRDESESQTTRITEGLDVYQGYYYTFYDGNQSDLDHYDVLLGENEARVDNESNSFGLTVNADLGFATLTSVTGYDDMDHLNIQPFTGTELAIQNASYGGNVESLTQEFRLTSNEGELVDWIVGLYYSNVEQDNASDLDMSQGFGYLFQDYGLTELPGAYLSTQYTQEMETLAAFVHTEWHLTDSLKLTAGARAARDSLDYEVAQLSGPACDGPDCEVLDVYYGITDYDSAFTTFLNFLDFGAGPDGIRQDGVIASASDSVDEDSITWRLGLDWNASDDMLLYGNVANGTKAHGFYGGIALASPAFDAYDPEDILAYELGLKWTLADGMAQLNAAVFYYDYEDQQVIVSFDPGLGLPNDNLTNVGASEITGAEVDLNWAPIEGLTLRFTGSWLDSELTDNTVSSPLPIFPGAELEEGEELAYAPEFTFSALARYDWSLSNSLNAFVQMDGDYTDAQLALPARTDTELDSRTVVNARAGLVSANGAWELSVWGRNLGDEEYDTYKYSSLPGTYNAHIGSPRTYGLGLRYNFGAY